MYATSMTQRNVLKATVPDRMVWLPKPACVIAAVRLSKALRRALKGDKQSARPCCPLQKLLLIKKIYHLNTLHIYPAKANKDSKTIKGRVTEFLYQALELRRPIFRFLQKARAWSRSKSLWPITTLLQITHYTRPNYTDRPQVNINCIEHFFTVHYFWATCACPEKNRVALKIFTVVNNVLFTFRICNNFRLTCKQSFPWNFSLYWIYFLLFRIFEQRRLPWKSYSII